MSQAAAGQLEYLRIIQSHWDRHQSTIGDAHNATLCRLVMIGYLERRPQDITSLAAGLYVSRQQAARRIASLTQWVTTERQGNRVVVLPSARLIKYSEAELPKHMAMGLAKWRKIAAIIGTAAMLGQAVPTGQVDGMSDVIPIVVGKEVAIEVDRTGRP